MRRPVLYRERIKSGIFWYARFFDASGKYSCARSLGIPVEGKKERRREAEEAAGRIATELRNTLGGKSSPPLTAADTLFITYLSAFWSPGSEYIREQAKVNKTPLSTTYIENNQRYIRLHISPFPEFADLPLSGLTRKTVRDYKLWAAEKGMSGRLINQCLQTMRVAVRNAVANGDLPADPFYGAGKAYHQEKEKGVLFIDERRRLIDAAVTDYYARLSVLLGLLCGMRRGEIRGLRWGDIGEGVITIRHNWVNGDGAKNPKRKGGLVRENTRMVPLPGAAADLLNMIVQVTDSAGPDDFVIQTLRRKGGPASAKYFEHALRRELAGIGIPPEEQKRRNVTFHSLRHSFVTLGRLGGFSDLEVQALAGHSARMMERYSHGDQVIDMRQAGEKLERALLADAAVNKKPIYDNGERGSEQNQKRKRIQAAPPLQIAQRPYIHLVGNAPRNAGGCVFGGVLMSRCPSPGP